jgi:uncharacterized protein YycO
VSATSTQKSTQSPPVKQINRQSLVAGDIIATRAHAKSSKGVRYFTHGDVSHSILYTGEKLGMHWGVDAMPGRGVTREQLGQKLTPLIYAVVFRHRTATGEQRARACKWAGLQAALHKPYDFRSAARLGTATAYWDVRPFHSVALLVVMGDAVSAWAGPKDEDASFTCSELVFRAYEIAGAPLLDKPAHFLSPGAVFRTDRLECLGRLV